jgi:hypothetical protein
MEIYIVTAGEYDGYRILDVYTNRADADARVNEFNRTEHYDTADVETFETK